MRQLLGSGVNSALKNIVKVSIAAMLAQTIFPQAVAQPDEASKTLREGAYTTQQASRGEKMYAEKCSTCHGENLAGVEAAPPLAGPNFRQSWEKQPLLALAKRIQTTI